MKIVFLGTPEFSISSLEALINTSWIELVAVFTQTDKPAGRGKHLTEPPVKRLALKHDIPVFQSKRISKEPDLISKLKELSPEVMVSCSYGQILNQEILDIACVLNVHASLLPKYRGAAPINWAILNGEKQTGITIMKTELSLDSGPILLQEICKIDPNENSQELYKRLSELGAITLIKALEKIRTTEAIYTPQDHSKATLAPMLKKEMGLINWSKTANEIHNQIRGLQHWPSAYTHMGGKTIKIWESKISQSSEPRTQSVEPGTIMELGDFVKVKTADGCLDLYKLQPENKNILNAKDWINGARVNVGDKFN